MRSMKLRMSSGESGGLVIENGSDQRLSRHAMQSAHSQWEWCCLCCCWCWEGIMSVGRAMWVLCWYAILGGMSWRRGFVDKRLLWVSLRATRQTQNAQRKKKNYKKVYASYKLAELNGTQLSNVGDAGRRHMDLCAAEVYLVWSIVGGFVKTGHVY